MILIPMAGEGSRFVREGYAVPKYRLPLGGETVFFHVVLSFVNYFDTEPFIFVTRRDQPTIDFITDCVSRLNIRFWEIKILDGSTSGQGETCYEALKCCGGNGPLFIFNIDTIRPGIRLPDFSEIEADGWIEVFKAEGDHWSFIDSNADGRVVKTAEKRRISDLASTGLYGFKTIDLYRTAYERSSQDVISATGESYIAPMYNTVISKFERRVSYTEVDVGNVLLAGTPNEYEALKIAFESD